jgi:hypothetical protein
MYRDGQRAMRVYPPWDKLTSKQAQKTQAWQGEYFLEIPMEHAIDWGWFRELYDTRDVLTCK